MAAFFRDGIEELPSMAAFTRTSTSADKKALAAARLAMYKTEQLRLKEAAASRRAAAAARAGRGPGGQANTPTPHGPRGRSAR
jgi:hypothetical protein